MNFNRIVGKRLIANIVTALVILASLPLCYSQEAASDSPAQKLEKEVEELTDKVGGLLEELEKKSILQFGLSFGPRYLNIKSKEEAGFKDARFSLVDSTLKLDDRDKSDFVASAVISITPFRNAFKVENGIRWFVSHLSFIANVNLAEFAGVSNESFKTVFNKGIEGGLGVGLSLTDHFALTFTFERLFNRRLRDYVLALENQKVTIDGKPLIELNREDDDIFRNDNLTAYSFKFVYFFNK